MCYINFTYSYIICKALLKIDWIRAIHMPGVEVDLNTIGGNILLLIFSLIPLFAGLILIWAALYYFKTGIFYGPTVGEDDKYFGVAMAIIMGLLFSTVGLSCIYIASKGILRHFTSNFNATYVAIVIPALFVFAYVLFVRWYWKKEEPPKKK